MPSEMPRHAGLAIWLGVILIHVLLIAAVLFGEPPRPPVRIEEASRAKIVPRRDGSVVVILPDGTAVAGDFSESSEGGKYE